MTPLNDIWQIGLALMAIIAIVIFLGFIAKHLQGRRGPRGKEIEVVDSLLLGPKERLVLVQVAGQQVLLGVNSQCINKLAEFKKEKQFQSVLDEKKSFAKVDLSKVASG